MRDLWTNIKEKPEKLIYDIFSLVRLHYQISIFITVITALAAIYKATSNNHNNSQIINNNNITNNYYNSTPKQDAVPVEREPSKIDKGKEGKIVVPPQETELTKILPQNVTPPEKTEEVYLPKRTLKRKRRKPTENKNARRKKEMQHEELMEKLFKQKQQKSKKRCDHPVKFFVCLAEGIFSFPKDVIIGR